MIPRTDAIIACPTTGKEYRVIGPADKVFPGQFKGPTNIRAGSRLWVLCGFELDDKPVMKDTATISKFRSVEPGASRTK